MPIEGFDPASVEHGELRAQVQSLESRLAVVEQRQDDVLDTLAAMRGARGLLLLVMSALSVSIGLLINFASAIKHWISQEL